MDRYIGRPVHAKSCTLAVISESGRRRNDLVVEANGRASVEALRGMPGRKCLRLDEEAQGTSRYEIFEPHTTALVVVGDVRAS